MTIHIRYGDKNGVLSQRLDIAPVTPRAMLSLQVVLYGNRSRVWGIMWIDINNIRPHLNRPTRRMKWPRRR